jgi:hypothetical protein
MKKDNPIELGCLFSLLGIFLLMLPLVVLGVGEQLDMMIPQRQARIDPSTPVPTLNERDGWNMLLRALTIQALIHTGILELAEQVERGEVAGFESMGAFIVFAALLVGVDEALSYRFEGSVVPYADRAQQQQDLLRETLRRWWDDEIRSSEVPSNLAIIDPLKYLQEYMLVMVERGDYTPQEISDIVKDLQSRMESIPPQDANSTYLPIIVAAKAVLPTQVPTPTEALVPATGPADIPTATYTWTPAPVPIETPTPTVTQTSTPMPTMTWTPTVLPASNDSSPFSLPASNDSSPFSCKDGCAIAPDPSCSIKGNVNSSGEQIYHVPSGQFYDRTDIKLEEGDRWFCTPGEAEAAGFRASQR